MAVQQTRFTFPQTNTKSMLLSMHPVQKFYSGPFDFGQIEFSEWNSKCSIWRYVGRRKNRFNIKGFDPSIGSWNTSYDGSFDDKMKQDGWELAGTILGGGFAMQEQYRAIFNKNIDVPTTGFMELPVGYGKGYVPGMKVLVYAMESVSTFITCIVLKYDRDILTVYAQSNDGPEGSFSSWWVYGAGQITESNGNLFTEISSYEGYLYDKPGLYADVWEISTNEGYVDPIVNHFRLHSRSVMASQIVPSTWFNMKLWPTSIPFSTNKPVGNPDWEMMVGVEPLHLNYLNALSLDAFKAILSHAQVQLIDAYFYRHETTGDIVPPLQVNVGNIQFDKQIYNWFIGKVPPTLFSQPGEYRLKFRLVWGNGPTWLDAGINNRRHYHDFWKTVIVDRSVDGLSDPVGICMANSSNILSARSSCSIVLGFNETETTFTQLVRSSASDLLEPREEEECYDESQVNVVRYGTSFTTTENAAIASEGGPIDTSFTPLVIADGDLLLPDDPITGSVPSGASVVENDYQVEGDKIKITTPYDEFSQSLYAYKGPSEAPWLGRIDVFFADQSLATLDGGFYSWTYPGGDWNGRFHMLGLVETNDRPGGQARRIIAQNEYSVNTVINKLNVSQSYIEAYVPLYAGERKFRIAYFRSIGGLGATPTRLNTQIAWRGSSVFTLRGKPDNSRMNEIVFVGKKFLMRYLDYNIGTWSESSTSLDLSTLQGTIATLTVAESINFESGRNVRLQAPSGYYALCEVISYSGTTLKVFVNTVFGTGVISSWIVHTTDVGIEKITLNESKTASDTFFCVYDTKA